MLVKLQLDVESNSLQIPESVSLNQTLEFALGLFFFAPSFIVPSRDCIVLRKVESHVIKILAYQIGDVGE